jgi:YegS/Rv2252/BmrU family lipid kinase
MKHMLVVTNPASGSYDPATVAAVVDTLTAAGGDVRVATSRTLADLRTELAHRADRDVVVVGGDGSMHAVVTALHDLGDLDGPLLALVPLGTGNDLARTLEIPTDPTDAVRIVLDGRTTALDVLVDDTGSVVVNAAHLGVGAEAGSAAARWKGRLGRIGYLVGAVVAGIGTSGVRVRVVADRTVVADGRRRVLQVAVANGMYVGGGTPIAPDARPDDGRLDVVVSFALRAPQRMLYAVLMKVGRHPEYDQVRSVQALEVSVSGDAFETNVDGELGDPVAERTWTVRPGALRMVVPNRPVDE